MKATTVAAGLRAFISICFECFENKKKRDRRYFLSTLNIFKATKPLPFLIIVFFFLNFLPFFSFLNGKLVSSLWTLVSFSSCYFEIHRHTLSARVDLSVPLDRVRVCSDVRLVSIYIFSILERTDDLQSLTRCIQPNDLFSS